jgi:hypothetical protein
LKLVDDKIIEKSLTFPWALDFDTVRDEKNRGTEVSMKYCEKDDGLEVGLTYFGSQLLGKTITLTTKKMSIHLRSLLISENWEYELEGEPNFPSVNIDKLVFKTGYKGCQVENEFLRQKTNNIVKRYLARHDRDMAEVEMPTAAKIVVAKKATDMCCGDCNEPPCVFLKERDDIVLQDNDAHAGTTTANRTRRRMPFKHMFYILNGGPGASGIRKRHPICVESGIRGLFPDIQYMGYKEK